MIQNDTSTIILDHLKGEVIAQLKYRVKKGAIYVMIYNKTIKIIIIMKADLS